MPCQTSGEVDKPRGKIIFIIWLRGGYIAYGDIAFPTYDPTISVFRAEVVTLRREQIQNAG